MGMLIFGRSAHICICMVKLDCTVQLDLRRSAILVTVAREGGAAEQESSRACRIREQTGINGSSRGDAVADTQPAGHQRDSERKQRQRWLQFIGNKLAGH